MTFRYSALIPIQGPNKVPRFREWAAEHVPGIDIHTPPQVPAKATAMTVRLKSAEDRQAVLAKLEGANI